MTKSFHHFSYLISSLTTWLYLQYLLQDNIHTDESCLSHRGHLRLEDDCILLVLCLDLMDEDEGIYCFFTHFLFLGFRGEFYLRKHFFRIGVIQYLFILNLLTFLLEIHCGYYMLCFLIKLMIIHFFMIEDLKYYSLVCFVFLSFLYCQIILVEF